MPISDTELLKAEMRGMVKGAQLSAEHLIWEMPDTATTKHQRELRAKHGTPRAFARDCVALIGEISVSEAETAIRKYFDEWRE